MEILTKSGGTVSGRRQSPARIHRLAITGIAAGGAGVGRLDDGRVAFVHRTAPGDVIEARVISARKRWVEAALVRVLEPGPGRREAPCPYYVRCGGCTLQHLTAGAQASAKAMIVADALRRIGGIDVEPPSLTPSPNLFGYRNRMVFTLVRESAGRVVAGLHERGRAANLLDIDGHCLLPEPVLREAWQGLRNEWGRDASRLPAGERLRLTLQAAPTGEVGLLVEDGFGDGRPEEILDRVPAITAIWKRDRQGGSVLLAARGQASTAEPALLEAGIFVQVNRGVAAALESYVDGLLGVVAGKTVVDAYCGAASRGYRLAGKGARVTGIELDPRSAAAARSRDVSGLRIVEGRVEDHLADLLPADLVIVNPPRTGLDATACDALLESPSTRVIYVSCDPATLARDLRRLAGRYTMHSVHCFDMFPQTAHVETVADLRCDTT